MGLPNLPRWIRTDRVDSETMLSVLLQHRAQCTLEKRQQLAALYLQEHARQDSIPVAGRWITPQDIPPPVPRRECHRAGCLRCATRRGGYKFRWYHERWGAG